MRDLFVDFENTPLVKWETILEKELGSDYREKPAVKGLSLNGAQSFEKRVENPIRVISRAKPWWICQEIDPVDLGNLNAIILESLAGGASAVAIKIDKCWSVQDFEQVFDSVILEFIYLRFVFVSEANWNQEFLNNFLDFIKSKDLKLDALNYSFSNLSFFDTKLNSEVSMPQTDNIHADLAQVLFQLEKNILLTESISKPIVALKSRENFYLNLVQVKVLKHLWFKITETYNKPAAQNLLVIIETNNQEADPNAQAIAYTQIAISSVIGGADMLSFEDLNYDQTQYGSQFANRITRNIQHVLQQESLIEEVIDASVGSYFLDNLASELNEKVWAEFRKLG